MITEKVKEIEYVVTNLSPVFERIVSNHTEELDEVIKDIEKTAGDIVDKEQIWVFYDRLTNCLYNTEASYGYVSLKNISASYKKQEVITEAKIAYKQDNPKATQTDVAAYADRLSKEDSMLYDIYTAAMRTIKGKIDAAWNKVSALKYRFNALVQEHQAESFKNYSVKTLGDRNNAPHFN